MTLVEDKQGAGAFQWNAGGWFGSQFGATLWLLLLGGSVLAQGEPTRGLFVIGCGLAANAVGYLLWQARDRLQPHSAIQMLIGACGVASLVGLLSLRGSEAARGAVEVPRDLWVLVVYPVLSIVFYLRERAVRGAAGSGA